MAKAATFTATECRAAATFKLVFFTVTRIRTLVGLLVGSRNNLWRECQVGAQVLDSFVGQVAVVVLPRKSDANVSLGLQGFHEHKNFQVGWSLDLRMLLALGVLLHDTDTLLEQVAVDSDSVFLWNPHDD